ncbi:unnamed protein product [Boreogadus saida]
MENMEALVRKLLEANMAQLAMSRELVGALTAGHAGAAVSQPGPQQAIHGLPPVNEAGLKAIKLECLQLKGRAGHKPELGNSSKSARQSGTPVCAIILDLRLINL